MELRRLGVKRVRPLRGGLQGWKDAGYPVASVEFVGEPQVLTQIQPAL